MQRSSQRAESSAQANNLAFGQASSASKGGGCPNRTLIRLQPGRPRRFSPSIAARTAAAWRSSPATRYDG